jgi:hypothetical protein
MTLFKNQLQKRLRKRFFVTPTTGMDFAGLLIRSDKERDGYSVFADVKFYPDPYDPPTEASPGEFYFPNALIYSAQETT